MKAYELTFEIPLYETDSNRILGVNKFAKGRRMKSVKRHVSILCHGKQPATPLKKFFLTTVRYGKRRMDDDNLHSMLKPYVDGLKVAGIIYNDSWKYLNPKNTHRDQVISQAEEKFIITVTGL